MPSKAFSFRLPDEAVQALETLNLQGETLNQTAQRVLMKTLGLSTPSPTATSTTVDIQQVIEQEVEKCFSRHTNNNAVDSTYIQNLVVQEIEKAIAQLRQEINQPTDKPVNDAVAGQEIEERLHKLEDRWNEIERFEADFNVWVDDLKDVSRLSSQVKDLSSKVENFDETLTAWVLRLADLMEFWGDKVSQIVDRMNTKLDKKLLRYYSDIRHDTLEKLRVGEQSAQGKAIDRFIKELEKYGEEY